MEKSPDAYRTISEVAEHLDLPQHVLRFWETRFPQIRPMKRGGGRRYYRREDVDLIEAIRRLLYGEGYTIKGVQRILKENGPRAVAGMAFAQPDSGTANPDDVERAATAAIAPPPPLDRADVLSGSPSAGAGVRRAGAGAAPGPDQIEKLKAVLYELAECARMLEAARLGEDA